MLDCARSPSRYGANAAHVYRRVSAFTRYPSKSGELRKAGVKIKVQQQPLKLLEIEVHDGRPIRRSRFGNRLSERSRSKGRAHHVEEAKRCLKSPEEVKKWGEPCWQNKYGAVLHERALPLAAAKRFVQLAFDFRSQRL